MNIRLQIECQNFFIYIYLIYKLYRNKFNLFVYVLK